MELPHYEKAIIETLALYSFIDEYEKNGILSKEYFNKYIDNLTKDQKVIVRYFETYKAEHSSKILEMINQL